VSFVQTAGWPAAHRSVGAAARSWGLPPVAGWTNKRPRIPG